MGGLNQNNIRLQFCDCGAKAACMKTILFISLSLLLLCCSDRSWAGSGSGRRSNCERTAEDDDPPAGQQQLQQLHVIFIGDAAGDSGERDAALLAAEHINSDSCYLNDLHLNVSVIHHSTVKWIPS